MRDYIQILALVITGILLLWFGYTLFFGRLAGIRGNRKDRFRQGKGRGTETPGDPQVCPICSSKLQKGDLVQTMAYPSITGGKDRLIHIRGCLNCLSGYMERYCPVCGASLSCNEILVARMFDRRFRRSHVHVLGCSLCRKYGTM
jgi:RNA polymerase subunit RPABC4/transcription elongation factor Spt4